jgi:hypothetical protein
MNKSRPIVAMLVSICAIPILVASYGVAYVGLSRTSDVMIGNDIALRTRVYGSDIFATIFRQMGKAESYVFGYDVIIIGPEGSHREDAAL